MSDLDESMINRAAPPGSMRYFSVLYAPPERRDALNALYVIGAEIGESARSVNHDVAHTRLQWWRQEIDRLVNGNPQHPATRALDPLQRHSYGRLHELLAAADMDLARMTYLSLRELRAYAARCSGVLLELMAGQLLDPALLDEPLRVAVHRVGLGVRLTEVIRDLRQDAHEGRLYLPLDELDKHQVAHEKLRTADLGPNAPAVLRVLRDAAHDDLQAQRALSGAARAALRPLLVLAQLHLRLLDRIAARNYAVATERIELGPIEKPWVAWRTARRAV